MTIETAYAAFTQTVATALFDAGFLSDAAALRIDPEAPIEPAGDSYEYETAASVEKVQTGPVRQILGRAEPRWVVERQCRVELLTAGPARDNRLEIDATVVGVLATLPNRLPTLSGTCERLVLTGVEDSPVEPNGVAKILMFTIRVRSGDPLGTSA